MQNPYESLQSNILSRIINNTERLNQSIATLNNELMQINLQNQQISTTSQILNNYSNNIKFNLQNTQNLQKPI